MSPKKFLTPEEKQTIFRMSQNGFSCRKIAAFLPCSFPTVSRVLKRIKEENSFESKLKSGRKRVSTKRDDRRLFNFTKKTKLQLWRIYSKNGMWPQEGAVRRRLRENGLKRYSATPKPKLSSSHLQQRLLFCKKYENWTVEDWRTIVFSDEVNIEAAPNGGRRKVWRIPDEKFSDFAIRVNKKISNLNNDMGMHCQTQK